MSEENHKPDEKPKPNPTLFDSSRFILREWGQAASIEAAPGVPVSKALVDRLKAPRERHGW